MTDPMSDENVAELRGLHERATRDYASELHYRRLAFHVWLPDLLDEVERLRAELAHAREQAAADVETHGQELMDAAIKQVTKDDPDGFSAVLRAAAIGSAAKYLRGEARQ